MKRNTPIILVAGAALVAALAGTASAAFAQPAPPAGSASLVSESPDETIATSISDLAQAVLDSATDAGKSNGLRGTSGSEASAAVAEQAALNRAVQSGEVSEQDYEANHRIYVECLSAAGFTPEFRQSESGFYVQLPFRNVVDSEQLDAALTECATYTSAVDMIFRIQTANPELLTDSRTVAAQCLVDGGYATSLYSAEQFEQDWLSDDFPFDATEAGPNDCLWGAGYGYFAEEG